MSVFWLLIACEGNKDTATADPCAQLLGNLQEGSEWYYHWEGEGSGSRTLTLSSADPPLYTYTLSDTTSIPSSGNSLLSHTFQRSCDTTGVFLHTDDYETTTFANGQQYYRKGTKVYDPPYLELPADLSPGKSWESTVLGVDQSESGEMDISALFRGAVVGETELKLSAGTFDCLQIDLTWVEEAVTERDCWAEGVGWVQQGEFLLERFSPGQ